MPYASRNDALEFAARTRKNLIFIQRAREKGEDVHPVTQLTNSLLGLIVIPRERNFIATVKNLALRELSDQGWPNFEITKGKCDTLGDLITRLRNAVAHGRLGFSSDSPVEDEVFVSVEDFRGNPRKLFWRAQISAEDLSKFALKLIELLEETIG